MKMDWYKENYPTGKLYIYQRRQQSFSSIIYSGDTFIKGWPYLFVRWSTPTNLMGEKMDFDNAVFFAHGEEVLIDRGMLKDFELVE